MLKDFKAFVMRGNVLDLAVAVIIGVAFGAIVTSLVNDIVMPPIGLDSWPRGLQGLVHQFERAVLPHPRRRQGRRSSSNRVRAIPEYGDQLHHRRVRHIPRGTDREQVPEARAGRSRHDEGLHLLRHGDSNTGEALPTLHLAACLNHSAKGHKRCHISFAGSCA